LRHEFLYTFFHSDISSSSYLLALYQMDKDMSGTGCLISLSDWPMANCRLAYATAANVSTGITKLWTRQPIGPGPESPSIHSQPMIQTAMTAHRPRLYHAKSSAGSKMVKFHMGVCGSNKTPNGILAANKVMGFQRISTSEPTTTTTTTTAKIGLMFHAVWGAHADWA
jgi:hypothetical protein